MSTEGMLGETRTWTARVGCGLGSGPEAWANAARVRVSRRTYDPDPISDDDALVLEKCCSTFRPFEGVRIVLLREAPTEIFAGWLLRVYGKVISPSALVFVGDRTQLQAPARVGYTAEGLVLEATRLGLGTCWIGGGVRRNKVAPLVGLAPREHVYSISALGRARERRTASEQLTVAMARAERRKPVERITRGPALEDWPEWARAGVDLARLAPSATNRQPWCFELDEEGVAVSYAGSETPYLSKRLDCGIAMLHFELGAREKGCEGVWELSAGRRIARWRPSRAQGSTRDVTPETLAHAEILE